MNQGEFRVSERSRIRGLRRLREDQITGVCEPLSITQIELVSEGRSAMSAPPDPNHAAVLDRDHPMVTLIRDVISPDVGESPAAVDDTKLLPTPIGIDRRPGHQLGEELMPERRVPVRFEKRARLFRTLITDPAGDRRPFREIEFREITPEPGQTKSVIPDLPTGSPRAIPPRPERAAGLGRRDEANASPLEQRMEIDGRHVPVATSVAEADAIQKYLERFVGH
ncbi:MAG: hypothetical protein GY895_12295 [Phycisphaera sp.]|nr:hypothetical protein [Phycisphaera sp.]